MQEALQAAQAEMQLAACSAFLDVLRRDLAPLGSYSQTFLSSILVAIDSRDPGEEDLQGVEPGADLQGWVQDLASS